MISSVRNKFCHVPTCKKKLSKANKVKNRLICKTCFKKQKSDYDHARKEVRRREIKTYTHKCKFCFHEFESNVHNKSYCNDDCKRRYANIVRKVKRRNESK